METCPWTNWRCVSHSGRTSNLTPLTGTLRFLSPCVCLCIHLNEDVHIKNYLKSRGNAPLQFDQNLYPLYFQNHRTSKFMHTLYREQVKVHT